MLKWTFHCNYQALDKTYKYEYNVIGNITYVHEYPYTPVGTEPSGTPTTTSFTYNTSKPDVLSKIGSQTVGFNDDGGLSYYKRTYNWKNGKLKSFVRGSTMAPMSVYEECGYQYNAYGQRISKTYYYDPNTTISDDASYNYTKTYEYDHNGRLINEKIVEEHLLEVTSTRELTYLYDASGLAGFTYSTNGATPQAYYYQRNLQGDVIAIYDTNGAKVVEYAYDAWGNCTIVHSTNDTLANDNPIRYRGYYYDIENNFYYLNSRYYSPEFRRFISPDDTAYLDPESVNGLNLYCYCNNDPINFVDPSGHSVIAVIFGIMAVVGMGLTIGGVVGDNNTLTAIGLTMIAIPALISGVGALLSGATYLEIVGGVTAATGLFTGIFATAEYQEAFTGNNWMLNAGMSEEWYNGLMLTTAALATAGTIATNVLTSIGNVSTPNQMMNSFNKHPNRWKMVKELVEPGRGGNKGGMSTYSNYINKWTGSKLGIHKIIRGVRYIHGPHFHPWI